MGGRPSDAVMFAAPGMTEARLRARALRGTGRCLVFAYESGEPQPDKGPNRRAEGTKRLDLRSDRAEDD